MVTVESLHCPNCGAPLPRQPAQTLAACLYCNSTIRITPGAAPVATHAVEVPPEAVDEVKRLLLLGQHAPAVAYYASAAQVSAQAAELAVQGIERTMAYYPPLNHWGVAMWAGLVLVGLGALLWGGLLIQRGAVAVGVLVMIVSALFTAANVLVLGRGLPGYLLSLRGRAAKALVLKTWLIRTARVSGQPVELTRLLLEVHPEGGRPYQAEANIYVRAVSKPKFTPGASIRVKYDPQAPDRIVVEGPAELAR
jgi:hypothetical protein